MDEREQYPYRYASPDEIAQLYQNMEGILVKTAKTLYEHAMQNGMTMVDFEDLLGEGRLAFMKCLDKYDTSKGVKFVTFFSHVIKNAMKDYIKITHRKAQREVYKPSETVYEGGEKKTASYETMVNNAVMRNNFNRTEADILEEDISKQDFFDLLDNIANTYMNDNERDVYYLYFRGDIRYRITEVAAMLGLKKYKVSELKNTVITILQNHLLEYDLEAFQDDYMSGFLS